jgi:hypothetical protein
MAFLMWKPLVELAAWPDHKFPSSHLWRKV